MAQMGVTLKEAQLVVEAWVDGWWLEALLDLGCTCTLVQQARGQPLDATQMVGCIHGDVCPYHLQWAMIRVRGDCQFLWVGVR